MGARALSSLERINVMKEYESKTVASIDKVVINGYCYAVVFRFTDGSKLEITPGKHHAYDLPWRYVDVPHLVLK